MISVLRPNPAFCLRRIAIVLRWNSSLVAPRPAFLPSRNASHMATSTSGQQPAWTPPRVSADEPTLKVYNSLTRTKVSPALTTGNGLVFVAWMDDDVSSSTADRVRPSQPTPCQVVQLWAHGLRRIAYGPCQVTSAAPPSPSRTPQKF